MDVVHKAPHYDENAFGAAVNIVGDTRLFREVCAVGHLGVTGEVYRHVVLHMYIRSTCKRRSVWQLVRTAIWP